MAIAPLYEEESWESPWPRPERSHRRGSWPQPGCRAHLRLVGPEGEDDEDDDEVPAPPAALRVLEAAPRTRLGADVSVRRRARASRRVVRRRAAAALLVTGLLVLLALPVSALAGRPAGANAARPAGVAYVVQPGDTLPSIAARFDRGDPAALERALRAQLGSDTVVPGERIQLP